MLERVIHVKDLVDIVRGLEIMHAGPECIGGQRQGSNTLHAAAQPSGKGS